MKKNIKPTLVLGTICLVVALLLSLVNMITGPIIEAAQNEAANAALLEVLPEGKGFEEIIVDEKYPAAITKGYKADGGYVFQASVTGKSAGLIIMIGVDAAGKIVGTKVIAEQETDSYDANVFPKVEGTDGAYKGMSLTDFNPYLVSGATLTSKAYSEAVKAALQSFVIATGGTVDVRDPAEILNDTCNAALGTSGKTFTKWFMTEVLEGVSAVYESDAGRVYLVSEEYIGVNADGTLAAASAEAVGADIALAADAIVRASTLTDVAKPDGTEASVTSIKVTATGNYVFELSAKGYQAGFEYGNKTPIIIKLSISADGKIIDCYTVSHDESSGIGDKCASEEYYEQWKGASDSDIVITESHPDYMAPNKIPADCTDIGALAGATYTTYGYQSAVKAAFAAFNKLTNGGN